MKRILPALCLFACFPLSACASVLVTVETPAEAYQPEETGTGSRLDMDFHIHP